MPWHIRILRNYLPLLRVGRKPVTTAHRFAGCINKMNDGKLGQWKGAISADSDPHSTMEAKSPRIEQKGGSLLAARGHFIHFMTEHS